MPTTKKISFKNNEGLTLSAKLDLPDGKPIAYALLSHCFACSKDLIAEARISAALTKHNIGVFRFDFTGLGQSEGEFSASNFSSNISDIISASDHLRENFEAPKILIGHSLGGTAILGAAPHIDEVVAVATIASPSDPKHIVHQFEDKLADIEKQGDVEVDLGGRKFHIRKQFIDDVEQQNILTALPHLKKALLVFHSPVDTVVSIEHARKIYDAAKHPKSFVSLDHANHLLTNKADAKYVANVLSAWASRYVDPDSDDAVIKTNTGEVIVTENGLGKFGQDVYSGEHQLLADEPPSVGGNDAGPGPYDYVLAGLGACTSMTIRMYADLKKIPLENVSVTLHHSKIHADDCADCETKAGMLDNIERKIRFTGDLTEEQRQKLLTIANKCPVHKTLTSEINISTELLSA